MTPLATGLSTIESVSVFVMICAIIFAYNHFPRVPTGGRGISLSLSESGTDPLSQYTCGTDCIVCPRCETETNSAYRYCSNCTSRLWIR